MNTEQILERRTRALKREWARLYAERPPVLDHFHIHDYGENERYTRWMVPIGTEKEYIEGMLFAREKSVADWNRQKREGWTWGDKLQEARQNNQMRKEFINEFGQVSRQSGGACGHQHYSL